MNKHNNNNNNNHNNNNYNNNNNNNNNNSWPPGVPCGRVVTGLGPTSLVFLGRSGLGARG